MSLHVIVSGGPNREKFTIEDRTVSQMELIDLLNFVPGIVAGKTGKDVTYILTPYGQASKSALDKVDEAKVVDASTFFNKVLSASQEQKFFDLFEKSSGISKPPSIEVDIDGKNTIVREKNDAEGRTTWASYKNNVLDNILYWNTPNHIYMELYIKNKTLDGEQLYSEGIDRFHIKYKNGKAVSVDLDDDVTADIVSGKLVNFKEYGEDLDSLDPTVELFKKTFGEFKRLSQVLLQKFENIKRFRSFL